MKTFIFVIITFLFGIFTGYSISTFHNDNDDTQKTDVKHLKPNASLSDEQKILLEAFDSKKTETKFDINSLSQEKIIEICSQLSSNANENIPLNSNAESVFNYELNGEENHLQETSEEYQARRLNEMKLDSIKPQR